LGQGAGQSMEDAIVLARCLEQNHDPMAALRAYEARRLPRTAMLAHQSRRIGQVASWKRAGSWRLRDLLFRISWKLGMHRMIEKFLMGYQA
jgi:2-polyprenyl-6-methoxyphenol hydroxylase-like FAD-dependent oxidoreductase